MEENNQIDFCSVDSFFDIFRKGWAGWARSNIPCVVALGVFSLKIGPTEKLGVTSRHNIVLNWKCIRTMSGSNGFPFT